MSLPVAAKAAKVNLMTQEEFKSAIVTPQVPVINEELNDSRLSQLFSNDGEELHTFTASQGALYLPMQINARPERSSEGSIFTYSESAYPSQLIQTAANLAPF